MAAAKEIKCVTCRTPFLTFNRRGDTLYCSTRCRKIFERTKAQLKWIGGKPKSGVTGITFDTCNETWRVKDGTKYLGMFKTVEEAKAFLKEYLDVSFKSGRIKFRGVK